MKVIPTTFAQALSQRKIKLFISADINYETQHSGVNYATVFDLANVACDAGFDCWEDFIANSTFDQIESAMNAEYHKMSNEFISKHGAYTPKVKETGYVYLMLNKRNGFTKIGFSKKPKHREKTLQSEEPEVELIFKGKGTMDDEKLLHDEYAEKRVRGEWFDLDDNDKYKIMNQIGGDE